MDDQAQPQAQPAAAAAPVVPAASLDPGRYRQFIYRQLNALGHFTGDKGDSWYEWEGEFSEIIENLADEQKINTPTVRVVSRGKYQGALDANPFSPDGPMNEYQHAVMIMNSEKRDDVLVQKQDGTTDIKPLLLCRLLLFLKLKDLGLSVLIVEV